MAKESFEVKLYLVDENGNSPCFGVDEKVWIEKDELFINVVYDFAHFLVANEGFEFSKVPGFNVCKNGIDYKIVSDND